MNTAMCVAFNAEKSIGAVGTSNPQIESFTLEEQSNIKALPSIPITNPGVNQFCFRNDNKVNFTIKFLRLLVLKEVEKSNNQLF